MKWAESAWEIWQTAIEEHENKISWKIDKKESGNASERRKQEQNNRFEKNGWNRKLA